MLDEIESNYNINTKMVYVAGISNGGYMTYRVACEMSDRVAAAAPIAGSVLVPNCRPSRQISLITFHGSADPLVPYNGGPAIDSVPEWAKNRDNVPSVQYSTSLFLKNDTCPSKSKETYNKGDETCETYSPCAAGSEVGICTIDGGGHTWPGGQYPVGAITLGVYKGITVAPNNLGALPTCARQGGALSDETVAPEAFNGKKGLNTEQNAALV